MTDIREIIEIVATYLSPKDQYTCLTVCKTWHIPFLYHLYRHVYINSEKQLELLQQTLLSNKNCGYLIRKVSLRENKLLRLGVGVHIKECKSIKVQQGFLNMLAKYCPCIESIACDESQLSSSIKLPLRLLERLTGLSTLNQHYMKSLATTHLAQLTYLRICGNTDIVNGPNSILRMLSLVPNLTHLTMERDEYQNKYKTPVISLEHLDYIHTTLPFLQELQFLNHFNFGLSNYYLHQHDHKVKTHPNLKKLKLEGTLQAYQWLQFIAYAYPCLASLELDLVHSPVSHSESHFFPSMQHINAQIKEAFQTIVQRCPHLSSILIKGLSTPLWLSPQFISIQDQKPFNTILDVQLYGLDSAGVERSVDTLTDEANTNIRLSGIRLPIWKKSNASKGKTWFDTIQPLSCFTSLAHLELDAVSMSFTDVSQHNGFELDTILNLFAHLKSLKLSGSHVLVSSNHTTKKSKLEELSLQKISFTPRTINYVSTYCTLLKRFIMYDCMQQPKEDTKTSKLAIQLDLSNLSLDLLVLYRIQHAHHMLQSRIPGARFLCLNSSVWVHLCDQNGTHALKVIGDKKTIDTIQRFDETSVDKELWEPSSTRIHCEKEWFMDLAFGYIDVQYHSVKTLFLDNCLMLF